jgi:prefoldin subunit 5
VSYPYITNKAALHSADKAKKIIKDSITEIESTIKTLDSAIKSMQ